MANVFCKGPHSNILDLVCHTVFVATPQQWHYGVKEAIGNMQMKGQFCVPIKSYLQKEVTGPPGILP